MVTVLPNENTTPYEDPILKARRDSLGTRAEVASPSVEQNTGVKLDLPQTQPLQELQPDPLTTVMPLPESDFNIPTTTEVSTKDLNVSTSDVMTARDEMESEAQKNLATLEGDRTTLQNQVLSSLQKLTGKSARQRELELQAGVEQDTADVKRLRTEIADIEAQMNQELQRRDLGITQRSILGEQSRIERRYLTEIGAKTAMMQALQGNIELAQATAQRTVDMEFAPIEQEIQVKLQELAFKEGDLTRAEEKVQAEAQAKLAEIEAEKESRNEIKSFALDLWRSGATQEEVMAAMFANSIEEAIAFAPKQMQGELTSSLTEYKFAQEQGYGGSFLDFQRTLANLKVTASVSADKLLSVTEAKALGVPYGTTENEAIRMGITPTKDATEAQGLTAGYALRMDQSDPIITNLTQSVLGYDSAEYALYKKMSLTNVFNPEIPSDLQSVFQAQRNFLNAVLRKESGAVISPTEFDEGAKQYFPVPGDSPQVLKQKEQTRKQAIQAFKSSAGKAYDELVVDFGEVRSLESYVEMNPNELPAIEALLLENPELTDDEVLQIINGK